MKRGQIIFWSIVGITAIGGGIFVWNRYFRKPKEDKKEPIEPEVSIETPSVSVFPLKQGSKSSEVSSLQSALNSLGANLTVDGDFGSKTRGAIEKINLSWYPVTKTIYDTILKKASSGLSQNAIVYAKGNAVLYTSPSVEQKYATIMLKDGDQIGWFDKEYDSFWSVVTRRIQNVDKKFYVRTSLLKTK